MATLYLSSDNRHCIRFKLLYLTLWFSWHILLWQLESLFGCLSCAAQVLLSGQICHCCLIFKRNCLFPIDDLDQLISSPPSLHPLLRWWLHSFVLASPVVWTLPLLVLFVKTDTSKVRWGFRCHWACELRDNGREPTFTFASKY